VLLDDFDFELPKTAIALRPAMPRDGARLLSVEPRSPAALIDSRIRDLPTFLKAGDVLVFNNTKVIPAVLQGYRLPRDRDAPAVEVSLTLLERLPDDSWRALARPSRRLRAGDVIVLDRRGAQPALAVTGKGQEGEVTVRGLHGEAVEALMEKYGAMPLPHYIARARAADRCDFADYQTVYASEAGAIAAPTAGLHFTPDLMDRIKAAGARMVFVTLHVGAGTFLPVKTKDLEAHEIHAERCEIREGAAQIINECRRQGGRLIAVGTTSLRLLETAANEDGNIAPYSGITRLFVRPGHRFKSATLLLTNFHLPKSTLFMLVCAFSGTAVMKRAYDHAIAAGYRFYSYGDACLLHRAAE
jgi:S-adenosylmethionine:tRNA ribosyltransferase-isomerase